MSDRDPPRWVDPGAGAPETVRRAFEAGREDSASDAQLARLRDRLGPLLEAPPASPVPRWGNGAKAALAGAGAAIAGAVLLWTSTRSATPPSPARTPSSAAMPSAGAATPAATPAATTPATTASASDADARGPTSPLEATLPRAGSATPESGSSTSARAPAPSAQRLSEADLLEQARRALQANPARALALANRHASTFPRGMLAQEREVIAVEALRRLGRAEEASRRAAAFGRAFPGSAYQRKLSTPP